MGIRPAALVAINDRRMGAGDWAHQQKGKPMQHLTLRPDGTDERGDAIVFAARLTDLERAELIAARSRDRLAALEALLPRRTTCG